MTTLPKLPLPTVCSSTKSSRQAFFAGTDRGMDDVGEAIAVCPMAPPPGALPLAKSATDDAATGSCDEAADDDRDAEFDSAVAAGCGEAAGPCEGDAGGAGEPPVRLLTFPMSFADVWKGSPVREEKYRQMSCPSYCSIAAEKRLLPRTRNTARLLRVPLSVRGFLGTLVGV